MLLITEGDEGTEWRANTSKGDYAGEGKLQEAASRARVQIRQHQAAAFASTERSHS